jgi:predicted  nucleic acid-binding Zn-ribbon protein
LSKETRALKDLKASLKAGVTCLNEKKDKIKDCIKSEQNRLDSIKTESEFFKEALKIVGAFFEAGFTTSDLEGLSAGIQLLGIRNDRPLTLARLLQALESAKTLVCLSDMVETKRKALTALNESSSTVKNELRTIEAVTLKIIEEARTACGEGIRDIAEREASAVEVLRRDFDERVAVALRTIETTVQNAIQKSKVELQGLEREKAQLEELLAPARWLFWTLESQDYANSLPLPMVSRMADRLAHWCEINVKGYSVRPSGSICTADFAFLPLQEYKLVACAALLSEGIRQFMLRKNQNDRGLARTSATST